MICINIYATKPFLLQVGNKMRLFWRNQPLKESPPHPVTPNGSLHLCVRAIYEQGLSDLNRSRNMPGGDDPQPTLPWMRY